MKDRSQPSTWKPPATKRTRQRDRDEPLPAVIDGGFRPPITGWGIHFGTVAPPNVGQRPTFDPESSLLWESTTLMVARSACRPTAVPKWIRLTGNVHG